MVKKKTNPNLIQNQKWYLKYAICEHCYFSKKPVKKLCNKCLKRQNNIQKLIKNNEDNLQSIKNNEDNLQSIDNNLILSYPYTSICIGITIVYSIITIFNYN
tara:strand:- start:125 stop:430 length:306 start_codon:yes stop_codon:yes gene_type:complete